MTILHVESGRNWLGGPAQVLYLMKGLDARGHTVALACPHDSGLGERAAEAGLDVRFTPYTGDADPRLFWGVIQAIRSVKPDLVHLHSRRGADTQGALAARALGLPVVLSRRVDYPIQQNPLTKFQYAKAYDHIIAISEAIRQVVLAGGISPDRVTTVHSSVDVHQFRPDPETAAAGRREMCVGDGETLFAIVAQLIPRKGHETLFRAVERLSEEAPGLRVAIFGKGAEEERLRSVAAQLGIERHLLWMGFHEKLHTLLPGIDALVHPARLEGLGVAILQAAACARPVIACPVGGIPEAVRPPDTGWLVPVDDDVALAAAMREVIRDPESARQKGLAGRDLMEQKFSVDAMVEGNIAIYKNVLQARR